jgi:hypothetical protein
VNDFLRYVGANYHDGDDPMSRPANEREYHHLDLFELACLWNAAVEAGEAVNAEDYEDWPPSKEEKP